MLQSDPLRIDRSLERLAQLEKRFRRALESNDALDHSFELRPRELGDEQLAELANLTDRDPLARPLLAWASALLVRQDCIPARRREAHALHRHTHPLDVPARGHFSPHALLAEALADAPRRGAWLDALTRSASSLASERFRGWEARAEAVARRAAPRWSAEHDALLTAAAERLLLRTRDAASSLDIRSLASWFSAALGHDAVGHYPSRLTPRSVVELLGAPAWHAGLNPELARLPALLGVSSVLRALGAFGAALHDAAAEGRRPFVLHNDPLALRRATVSALFGTLPALAPFAQRRLDIARSDLASHERTLARVSLLSARAAAFSVLLAARTARGNDSYRETFVERGHEALGFEPPAALAGVVFAREDAPSEFAGLLLGVAESRELVERHDEDWFRNPRAVAEQRARLESPPVDVTLSEAALDQGVELLARWFGEKL